MSWCRVLPAQPANPLRVSAPADRTDSLAMPDIHWGYGFPIGGVAAFDPAEGGVVSAGGVGFDISCGVRCLHTGLAREDIMPVQKALAHELSRSIPAGVGSTGAIRLDDSAMEAMLAGGARWAVQRGWGEDADLERIEEGGQMKHAKPGAVSAQAKRRQRDEMGTLGSGNHYLEVQEVAGIFDEGSSRAFGVKEGDIVVMIHCGSRGLGHQIGTEFLKRMALAAPGYGIALPDRELACAPIRSELGEEYLGAMRAAINCALANRQILTHLVREVFRELAPQARLPLLYDVSHNTCKLERHGARDRRRRRLRRPRRGDAAARDSRADHAQAQAGRGRSGDRSADRTGGARGARPGHLRAAGPPEGGRSWLTWHVGCDRRRAVSPAPGAIDASLARCMTGTGRTGLPYAGGGRFSTALRAACRISRVRLTSSICTS